MDRKRVLALGLTGAVVLGLTAVAWVGRARADGVGPTLPRVAEPQEARHTPEREPCCSGYYREAPPPVPVYREPCCVRYVPPPPPSGWVPHSPYYHGQHRPHVRDWQGFQYPSPPPVEYRWR